MARTKVRVTKQGASVIQFTAEEEAQRDAEEAAWAAGEAERAWAALRTQRNTLISATDWRVLPDQPVSQPWLDYRQALRDLPANTTDPANPTWPTMPASA
jgi:hypothetical protein